MSDPAPDQTGPAADPVAPPPLILAFDTSGPHVSAALFRGGATIDTLHEDMTRGQAERLVPALEELLARNATGWATLDAIGVGTGPGNFTGIRISVATARGLALGLGIPAVGVSTLEAAVLGSPRPVIAAAPAVRDGAFFQRFDPEGAQPPGLMQSDDTGPGWQKLDTSLPARAYGLPLPSPPHDLIEGIARIAATRYRDPALPRPAPMYIRPADAAPSRDTPPVLLD